MVEHRGLGRARAPSVVMHGDGVEDLGEHRAVERRRTLFDQAKAEMDVAEQLSLGRGQEQRAAVELPHAPHVVQECRGEQRGRCGGERWSCAASRQSVATPTVCSRSPPA